MMLPYLMYQCSPQYIPPSHSCIGNPTSFLDIPASFINTPVVHWSRYQLIYPLVHWYPSFTMPLHFSVQPSANCSSVLPQLGGDSQLGDANWPPCYPLGRNNITDDFINSTDPAVQANAGIMTLASRYSLPCSLCPPALPPLPSPLVAPSFRVTSSWSAGNFRPSHLPYSRTGHFFVSSWTISATPFRVGHHYHGPLPAVHYVVRV